ncbi:opine metallophore biosynthesis dehydrogenase [Motiliproteus sp. MSK22-1]|uniref:opine metallophore biosynthesis dehydrogenase n=1 Tax=Motiliproteus sp. MSK22-1 TaxID=1897630 RepID=UPI00097762F0|nr:opine metallophore biosynthesis dehydrogenase [Motiliproteus sp. MSK22-1]OMH26610.1 hypothetical protein BGP75_23215 [Motiliproteus sp. MSK22-1]
MSASLGRVLIVGAGPAAFQTARIIANQCDSLGLVNRLSERWLSMYQLLNKDGVAQVNAATPSLERLSGRVKFDFVFKELSSIRGQWDTLILATPSHVYCDVLGSLPNRHFRSVRQVVLISSLFGGHQLVKGFFSDLKLMPDVLVFSNYFAATKFNADNASVSVITKAAKKRIYAYSSSSKCNALLLFEQSLGEVGIEVVALGNGFSVEGRNITSYVHPAFFITPFSLNHIFSETGDIKYMYKLFPEGPVTTATIHTLVELWRDISKLTQHFSGTAFNLLQFLNDDNYPVHQQTISRDQIDRFMELSPIEQEYLIYVRYSAILIDPFSTPDAKGRYFDFSAVPYAKGKVTAGKLHFPRVPKEDLQTLYWFKVLAIHEGIELPAVNRVLEIFETWLNEQRLPNQLIEEFYAQAENSLSWVVKGIHYE